MQINIELESGSVSCSYTPYSANPITVPGPGGLMLFNPGFASDSNAHLVLAAIAAVPRYTHLALGSIRFKFEVKHQQADQVWGTKGEPADTNLT